MAPEASITVDEILLRQLVKHAAALTSPYGTSTAAALQNRQVIRSPLVIEVEPQDTFDPMQILPGCGACVILAVRAAPYPVTAASAEARQC